MSKRIFRSVVTGFLIAILPTVVLLNFLASSTSYIKEFFVLLIEIGAFFSVVLFTSSSKLNQKNCKMMHMGRTLFFVVFFLALLLLMFMFNAIGAGGALTYQSLAQVTFLILMISIVIPAPLILIGYFREAKNQSK